MGLGPEPLVVPAVLHGLWDFGLTSVTVIASKFYLGGLLLPLADIIMVIILLIGRHHIEPARRAVNG